MAGDIVVSARGVWKRYSRSLASAAWHGLRDALTVWMGHTPSRDLRDDEFWSLQDVSLELRRGEVLGVIGANGSGKTTLLKTLSGLLRPDRGEIRLAARVGWLVNVGAGLHPHLTGRENVLLRADLDGLRGHRRTEALDDVAAFAEIGDFIDSPVSFYSSGMRMRLGFGIATMTKRDLLIIDESLAVGDQAFRFKCYERVADLTRDAAVLFVDHSMGHVVRLCTRALYMAGGRVEFDGDVQGAIDLYRRASGAGAEVGDAVGFNRELCVLSLGPGPAEFEHGAQMHFWLSLAEGVTPQQISVVIHDQGGHAVVDLDSDRDDYVHAGSRVRVGPYRVDLRPGLYRASAIGNLGRDRMLFASRPVMFSVRGRQLGDIPVQPRCRFVTIDGGDRPDA